MKLVCDWLLIIGMILLTISGIAMSEYVFTFLNLSFLYELAKSVHMVTSFSCFGLYGFHLGLHWTMFLVMFRKALQPKVLPSLCTRALRFLACAVSVYGIYALIKRDVFSYIMLKMHFILYDAGEPVIYYIFDLLAITVLTVFAGHYLQKVFTHLFSNKQKGALQ